MPDKGWDYNPSDRLAGVNKALADKRTKSSPVLMSALDDKLATMATISNEFTPAKTVKEANKWAVDNNLVDYADYSGVKVDVANAFNESLFEHIRDFPELRINQEFIGTIQAQVKKWRDYEIKSYLIELKKLNPEINEKELKKYAEEAIKEIIIDNRLAQSSERNGVKGIAVNKVFGHQSKRLAQDIKDAVDSQWYPAGCDSIKSLANHEMGHQLTTYLDLSNDEELLSLYYQYDNKYNNHSYLSEYAFENIYEFIAEGWNEFRSSNAPRILSEKIGNIVIERYNRKKLHD